MEKNIADIRTQIVELSKVVNGLFNLCNNQGEETAKIIEGFKKEIADLERQVNELRQRTDKDVIDLLSKQANIHKYLERRLMELENRLESMENCVEFGIDKRFELEDRLEAVEKDAKDSWVHYMSIIDGILKRISDLEGKFISERPVWCSDYLKRLEAVEKFICCCKDDCGCDCPIHPKSEPSKEAKIIPMDELRKNKYKIPKDGKPKKEEKEQELTLEKIAEVLVEMIVWMNDGEKGVGDPSYNGIYTKSLQKAINIISEKDCGKRKFTREEVEKIVDNVLSKLMTIDQAIASVEPEIPQEM